MKNLTADKDEYNSLREELVEGIQRMKQATTWIIAFFLVFIGYFIDKNLPVGWMFFLGAGLLYLVAKLARDRMESTMLLGSYLVWFHEYCNFLDGKPGMRFHAWNRLMRAYEIPEKMAKWGGTYRTIGLTILGAFIVLFLSSVYKADKNVCILNIIFSWDGILATIGLILVFLTIPQVKKLLYAHTHLKKHLKGWLKAFDLERDKGYEYVFDKLKQILKPKCSAKPDKNT